MRTAALIACLGLVAACEPPPPAPGVAIVEASGPTADEAQLRALARGFYADHADDYDMLVLWGGAGLAPAGSFYYPVRNDVAGLGYQHVGDELFDHSAEFGSARLSGIIWMGPDWRTNIGVGTRAVWDILLEETGHRWAASVIFRDDSAKDGLSDALLANPAHWSFFLDSGASPMGGNDWSALGDGRFVARSVDRAVFSPLDLYLMGLLDADAVPPLTLLGDLRDEAGRPSSVYTRASQRVTHELTVRATARTVPIEAILAVEGRRSPTTGSSARQLRQAWLHVGAGDPPVADLERLAGLQVAWPDEFRTATRGLGTVTTDW